MGRGKGGPTDGREEVMHFVCLVADPVGDRRFDKVGIELVLHLNHLAELLRRGTLDS